MESVYNPQAPYYYLEVTQAQMDTVLSNSEANHPILQMFGYPNFDDIPQEVKDSHDLTDSIQLKHIVMTKKELAEYNEETELWEPSGNWGISVQITPYSNFIAPSSAVNHRLTAEQFDLVLQYFGVTELLTKEEYLALPIKIETI